MSMNEFLEILGHITIPFNTIENCPYLYGTYMNIVICPITYVNLAVNKHLLSIDKVGIAIDMLKLNSEEAEQIIKAADGTGDSELRDKLKSILKLTTSGMVPVPSKA